MIYMLQVKDVIEVTLFHCLIQINYYLVAKSFQ